MKSRYTKEKIYDLLPSIYRIKDKEEGEPLKALLEIISEQVELVEKDIDQLYLNYSIETCDESRVPYIGDLLHAKILNPVSRSTLSHRGWVANTISYRRRKGTLATIEQLSRDVTGWNCRAVEFFQNLITTQYLNHLRMEPKATIDTTKSDLLELIGTPFDRSAHTLDVRHIESKRGYYNVPNIGIFLWRLQAYPVINAPAFSLGDGKYTFSQIGYDLPIYNHPETETSIDHIATELNVPARIRRRALEESLKIYKIEGKFPYQESIKILKRVSVGKGKVIESQIPPESIIVCNLSNWHHRPPEDKELAIDPEYGRIIFQKPEKLVDVHVSYFYGFSGEIGGGFYDREKSGEKVTLAHEHELQRDLYHYKISKNNHETYQSLSEALAKWENEEFRTSRDAIFEIIDSEIYTDVDAPPKQGNTNPIVIKIPKNITLTIKSQNLQRPVLRLNKPLTIRAERGSRLIFDGILFILAVESVDSNSTVEQLYDNNNTILKIEKGDLSELIVNHCTFVPAKKDQENMGRLLFSWENIPQVTEDVKRLKMYLFDILNEKWIKGNGVIVTTIPDNNIIAILRPGTTIPSLKLELKMDANTTSTHAPITSGTVSIKTRVIGEPHEREYHTIYKLPMLIQNHFMNVYSSMYSIGIFGDSADSTRNSNDNKSNRNSNNFNNNHSLKMSINRSIMGRIDSSASGASLKIVDSIIDGKGKIEAIKCTSASIENTTVFGKITCEIINLASNSLFTDILDIDRRQQGCVRFSYIPSGSRIPRPYRCVLEYESDKEPSISNKNETFGDLTPVMKISIPRLIRPQFTSINYGDDGYGQLHKDVEKKIFEGGDNGSEMGAFNYLYNPQRIRNLSSSIEEYLKFGLEAGIFLVT